jgi:hypothetical protein
LVVAIAFAKVNLGGRYLMELRTVPKILRDLFTGYTIAIGTETLRSEDLSRVFSILSTCPARNWICDENGK